MKVDEFLDEVHNKSSPAPDSLIRRFEREIEADLPPDYRDFLAKCNGGSIGGRLRFTLKPRLGLGVHDIYGLRGESRFSLLKIRTNYLKNEPRVPPELLAIMNDSVGNQVCIGLCGDDRGKVVLWDFEVGRLDLIGRSFVDFVSCLSHV